MEEIREQPVIMPAQALNPADDNGAMSEIGSQNQDGELGKFKSVQALMDAYSNLQAEFTKKCQALSELKQAQENEKSLQEQTQEDNLPSEEHEQEIENKEFSEEDLQEFLSENSEAQGYAEEIRKRFPEVKTQQTNPYAVAWAEVLVKNIKENTSSDPIINQYVLTDENIKNKIINDYFINLNKSQPPIVISSQSGERLSGVLPDSPKTLAEAKKQLEKLFS